MHEEQPREMLPALNVRYVGIGQLTVYFVSDDELRIIERGGPSATILSLAIAFLSLGIGSFVSMMLTDLPKSMYKFTVVVILTTVSIAAGIILTIVWWRFRRDVSAITARIRARDIPSTAARVMETGNEGTAER
jgi:hypothetical protein